MYLIWRNTSNVNSPQFHDWNKLILTSCKRDSLKLCWASSIIKNPSLNTLEFFLGLLARVKTPCKDAEIFFWIEEVAVHRLGPTGHGLSLFSVTETNVLWRILRVSNLKLGNSIKSRPLDIFNGYGKDCEKVCSPLLIKPARLLFNQLVTLIPLFNSPNVGQFFSGGEFLNTVYWIEIQENKKEVVFLCSRPRSKKVK